MSRTPKRSTQGYPFLGTSRLQSPVVRSPRGDCRYSLTLDKDNKVFILSCDRMDKILSLFLANDDLPINDRDYLIEDGKNVLRSKRH